MISKHPICPLCTSGQTQHYHQDLPPRLTRDYWHCHSCDLVFADPKQHLSADDEKAQYDFHDNQVDDPGYQQFLNKLLIPLCAKQAPPATLLDMGCGPGPALVAMASNAGYEAQGYDPFFAPREELLDQQYDLLSCTEVIEHVFDLKTFFSQLTDLLSPQGWLGIMTSERPSAERFATWHYKNDPTHVAFFSQQTFNYLAKSYHLKLENPTPNVWLFNRL